MGFKIKTDAPIVAFMGEYASYLLNKPEVRKDGKTAYERAKGKSGSVLDIEFGEELMWKKAAGVKMEKINPRWEYGIFVVVKRRSGELWVRTEDGLVVVRTVRRISFEQRWSEDCVR